MTLPLPLGLHVRPFQQLDGGDFRFEVFEAHQHVVEIDVGVVPHEVLFGFAVGLSEERIGLSPLQRFPQPQVEGFQLVQALANEPFSVNRHSSRSEVFHVG